MENFKNWAKMDTFEAASPQGVVYHKESAQAPTATLILLVGIPGSGKSLHTEAARQEKTYGKIQVISTDAERLALLTKEATLKQKRERLSRFDSKFEGAMIFDGCDLDGNPRRDKKLGINDRIVNYLTSGTSVVYDATNLNPKTRHALYKKIKDEMDKQGNPYNIELRLFHVSRSEASRRIAADVKANKIRANVPEDGIARTWEAYTKVIKDLEAEVAKFDISHVEFY